MSCCSGGWFIGLDRDYEEYYRSVQGEFGEKLRRSIIQDENGARIAFDGKGDCVFLNDRKLCEIYLTLGPDALCRTCQTFPRTYWTAGNISFRALSASCPEVVRRVMFDDDSLDIDIEEIEAEQGEDREVPGDYLRAFATGLELLQNRDHTVAQRAVLTLVFISQFQTLNAEGRSTEGLLGLFEDPEQYSGILADISRRGRDHSLKLRIFSLLFNKMLENSNRTPMWKDAYEFAEKLKNGMSINDRDLEQAFSRLEGDIWEKTKEALMVFRFFEDFGRGYEGNDYFERFMNDQLIYILYEMYVILGMIIENRERTDMVKAEFYTLCSRIFNNGAKNKTYLMELVKQEGFDNLEILYGALK